MKTKSTSRRNFLIAAGAGSAGAVAAVATLRKPGAGAKTAAGAATGDGYRASEHILKYYKTAEV
jgi:hypothetical protein